MRVSVAMCTYNGARFLKEQLESIARQTFVPRELIICDDCSSDSTPQILEDFAKHAPFDVRVFKNKANLGYIRNFEQAIRICSGDLISLSDQDDIWEPHKLAILSSRLREDASLGGVFSDGQLMTSASETVTGSLWHSFRFDIREQEKFRSMKCLEVLLRRNVVTGMTLMFRSDLRSLFLPLPASWEHDAWIAIMLCLYSQLDFVSNKLVRYRLHDKQEIGVPPTGIEKVRWITAKGIPAFLESTRRRNIAEYTQTAAKYEDLMGHLELRKEEVSTESKLRITAKAEHIRAALEALSKSRLMRFQLILSQAGRYRRYSVTGLRAMFRDLIV